jgi:hypothetical protein
MRSGSCLPFVADDRNPRRTRARGGWQADRPRVVRSDRELGASSDARLSKKRRCLASVACRLLLVFLRGDSVNASRAGQSREGSARCGVACSGAGRSPVANAEGGEVHAVDRLVANYHGPRPRRLAPPFPSFEQGGRGVPARADGSFERAMSHATRSGTPAAPITLARALAQRKRPRGRRAPHTRPPAGAPTRGALRLALQATPCPPQPRWRSRAPYTWRSESGRARSWGRTVAPE